METTKQPLAEELAGLSPRSPGRRPGGWLYLMGILVLVAAASLLIKLMKEQKSSILAEGQARAAAIKAGPIVRVVTVGGSPRERSIALLGEARPFQVATLYAKVSGYLREVRVDKGDKVAANQILAVIESPETDQQYVAALADAKNKRVNAERARTLVKREMIAQQEADQAEADAQVAEANVAALATMKSYQVLRAPFPGTVTARYADPGALLQNAANSQTSALPVVTVSETDLLRVYVYPDQRDAVFVHDGDPAEISMPERPELKLNARVTRASGELDPKTRTMLTEIDFDNRRGEILSGSFVHVSLQVRAPQFPEVPAEALVVRREKTFVAVISPENKVSFREVSIANDDGQTVRIASGLREGERVALNLGDSVPEGGQVQPVGSQ